MRPEEVGVPQATLVRQAFGPPRRAAPLRAARHRLDRTELDRSTRAVIELADREKVVSDNDLAAIVQRVRSGAPARRPGALVAGFRQHPCGNRLRDGV